MLDDDRRIDWLRLIRTDNVGPVTFRHLINRFGGAGPALDALPDLARRGGRTKPLLPCSRAEAEAELAAARAAGADCVVAGEPGYPALLAHIDGAPPLLYVAGRTEAAERPMVGIVGARNASAAGRRLARTLAGDLGGHGFTIVSGLARGIDAAAHEGSLATGTIAVLPGGILTIYPEKPHRSRRAHRRNRPPDIGNDAAAPAPTRRFPTAQPDHFGRGTGRRRGRGGAPVGAR